MMALEAQNLSVRLNGHEVLSDVTLSIKDPSFSAIMGPNGAGKTTLLKVMLGMLKPSNGWIRVLGIDPSSESRKLRRIVGYVPQRERISFFVPMKVKEVIAMPLLLRKPSPRWLSSRDLEIIKNILERLDLKGMEDRVLEELSGGQQQKVFIAKALVSNPSMLLLDEPFNGVDVKSQVEIIDLLSYLKENGVSIFIVLHDVSSVAHLIDDVILLHKRLIAYGKPNEVLKEEILRGVYGDRITVYSQEPFPMFMPRDAHG